MEIPFKRTKYGITIEVKVETCSSRKGISGIMGDALKVKLTAAPVEGAANEQLIGIIAEAIGVKKSQVRIMQGLSSKKKVVEIKGISSL